ncbi:MAG: NADH-quinone oxidoreductase subunit NuoK [Nitrospirota bacterium]|uniref:NADH-ubiquinone oxidoreductase chain K n=1 Tax=hydrothermal vent metagenome TaxID=652676 RepID=A0A3B1D7F2_9ZZZZ|nr:NADH-quinone oxidoreductase subunit NuoK [Nitrospirota bacterium]NOY84102.1 NADH-quinone oxidoreductase subunit NuoK [Candidatus Manganitrophaceae bacterium]
MIPLEWYLTLGFFLFAIGVTGVLVRRNIIMMLLSVELILNSANITFVAYSNYHQSITGQMMVFFILTMAAAEVALGLALVIALYRVRSTLNIDEINRLKW